MAVQEKIGSKVLSKFEEVTGIDVTSFLTDYTNFIDNDYQHILDYYGGDVETPNAEIFDRLANLRERTEDLIKVFEENAKVLETYDFWVLFDKVQTIQTHLETISNTSRYLRSAIVKNDFTPDVNFQTTLKQGQTLEDLERNELNSEDWQNDWINTAIDNDLREEDYNSDGGAIINVSLTDDNSLFLNSIIDNIDTGEKTYGKDIAKKINIVNGDLEVLSYEDTLDQTLRILSDLRRGDHPQFPTLGINPGIAVGSNLSSIQYPSIFRQLYAVFQTDDSLKQFKVTDISKIPDRLALTFEVKTKYGEVKQATANL